MTTRIFAPAPPTAAQLDQAYLWGWQYVDDRGPVTDFAAEYALIADRRADVPAGGILDRYFDGATDRLDAMRGAPATKTATGVDAQAQS